MAVLHRGLDVFGVVVPAADDDEILEPARDEQLAFELEAQVTGTQERSAPGVCEERRECLLRFGGPAPVALGDAPAGEPDLPNLASPTWPPVHRIRNDDLVAALCPAATYERRGGRVLRRYVHDMVPAKGDAVHVSHHRHGPIR